jgi:hypothetical protein
MKTRIAIISLTFIGMQCVMTANSEPLGYMNEEAARKKSFDTAVNYLLKQGRHQLNAFCATGRKENAENRSYWNTNTLNERAKGLATIGRTTFDGELLGAQAFAMSQVCPQVW